MPPPALLILLGVFSLSNVLFLLGAAATPWLGLGLSALLIAAVVLLFRRVRMSSVGGRWILGLGSAALAVSIVGGAGHLMFTTEDWQVRDSVLHDLMTPHWPVTYGAGESRQVLRAPLGFYMLPALVGRWLGPGASGLGAAHGAVLAQNSLLLTSVLLLVVRGAETARARLIAAGVFLLFSGWDALFAGALLLGTSLHGTPVNFGLHIDHLNGLEYSSFLTDLFWAPNHSLPAFAFVGLYLAWKRGECSAPALALFGGLCLLWSPLAVMGMTPFVAFALLTELREGRLRWREVAIGASAILAVAPMLVFLQLDAGAVDSGWSWREPDFALHYITFLAFDIAPILYLLIKGGLDGTGVTRLEAVIVGLMLVLIPFYSIGVSNDFVMRVSVVPLALAAVVAGRKLAGAVEARRKGLAAVFGGVLAIGAITPALEVVRAFIHPASAPVTLPLPEAAKASAFAWAPTDGYLARPASLARFGWLLKPAPAEAAVAGRP